MADRFTTMRVGNYTFEFDFDTGELRLSWAGAQTFLNRDDTIALGDFLFEVMTVQGRAPRILPLTITSVEVKTGEPTLRECPYCHQMHRASDIEQCPLKPR